MKYFLRFLSLGLILAGMVACAPDSRDQGAEVVTTYVPPAPDMYEEDGYKIVRGSTRVQDMSVNFDPVTKGMILKGKMEFLPVKASAVQNLDFELSGILDEDGFIALKKSAAMKAEENVDFKVAAKATCLSANGDCRSSFIDIYIYHQEIIYHHQVESLQDDIRPSEDAVDPVKTEESESEGGADEVEGEPGRYVGNLVADIEDILEVKKTEAAKTEPVKEGPKSEEPKSGTPKSEIPKNEVPKSESPKKEEPKREEPRKDPPKISTPRTKAASQAVGSVNNGRLEKATDLLIYEQNHRPAGFRIMRPERKTYFGASELAYVISKMGDVTKKHIPGYNLSVGDLSRQMGGRLGSHKSHQNGLDVDVAYYFNNKSFQGYFASAVAVNKPHANWMKEEQWTLFKEAVSTQLIDRIFIHKTLKTALCAQAINSGELKRGDTQSLAAQTLRRLIPDLEHHNHFHLRVKCSKAQVRCRQMAEPANTTGCF